MGGQTQTVATGASGLVCRSESSLELCRRTYTMIDSWRLSQDHKITQAQLMPGIFLGGGAHLLTPESLSRDADLGPDCPPISVNPWAGDHSAFSQLPSYHQRS